MNDKQKNFIEHYCTDAAHNASEAYRMAYPKCKKGFQQNGSKLLLNTVIKTAINKRMAELAQIVDYCYDKAHKLLQTRLGYLEVQAAQGNVQAVQAQTAIIREMDDITGLHKQNLRTEAVNLEPQSEADRKLLSEIAAEYIRRRSIKLKGPSQAVG